MPPALKRARSRGPLQMNQRGSVSPLSTEAVSNLVDNLRPALASRQPVSCWVPMPAERARWCEDPPLRWPIFRTVGLPRMAASGACTLIDAAEGEITAARQLVTLT